MKNIFPVVMLCLCSGVAFALTAQEITVQQTKNSINILIAQAQANVAQTASIKTQLANYAEHLRSNGVNWPGMVDFNNPQSVNWSKY